MLRNRRTLIFTLIMPSVFFLLFGTDGSYQDQRDGRGNVTAYVLISMAVYGAMLATTSGGAAVSVERAVGWSRQLRLTPLRPVAYVADQARRRDVARALASVAVVFAGRLVLRRRRCRPACGSPRACWPGPCAVVFAAFGLFMGYLLPSENVMQILGPVLALLSFAGGLFVPLDQMSDTFAAIAKFSPVYGVGVIARYPMTDDGTLCGGIAQRRDLDLGLRGRSRLAVPPRHGPGLTRRRTSRHGQH